jgi:hypothetical protein
MIITATDKVGCLYSPSGRDLPFSETRLLILTVLGNLGENTANGKRADVVCPALLRTTITLMCFSPLAPGASGSSPGPAQAWNL